MKLSPARSHLELKYEDNVRSYSPFLKSISCMWMYIYIDYPCWWGHQKRLGQMNFGCKFQLFTISPPYPHTRRLLERQSSNNHLKRRAYNFLRVIFSRSFSVHSFLQGWNPPFLREPPSFWSKFNKLPPFLRAIQIGACKLQQTL